MKILIFSTDFPPNSGGVAVFLHNICLQLYRLGHQVDVLTVRRDNHKTFDQNQPYEIYRYLPFRRAAWFVPAAKIFYLYFRHQYDIFFMGRFLATPALGIWLLHKLQNVPYIILTHGRDLWGYSFKNKREEIMAKILLRDVSLMLVNSRFAARRTREEGYKESSEILTPGVNEKQFHPKVNCSSILREYALQGRKVLFTAARLVPKKNIESVLLALRRVIEQVPEVCYLVAGDGQGREQLEKLRDRLGLHSYVYFLGNIEHEQLPMFYCASDIFVLPSREVEGDVETFGISFIEANACGKPVIGGQSGGIGEAVINGETGLLVDPHNPDEIAAAIIRLLTDQELALRLGNNGRRRVEQELNWDKVGERVEGYLERVAGRK